ncbi:MAG: hypothetical protein IJJ41_07815 [Clostridia bacterium]|nr:hypothetical protein [Clostridia bacterium]
MEVFCRKKTAGGGDLEYKMVESKTEHAELGRISVYGLRVKYASRDNFSYYSAGNLACKPQVILQIIKYLFDKSVMPENVYENIECFFKSN